ncbi:MAG: ABC transporter permease [Bacteroidia bacterium]
MLENYFKTAFRTLIRNKGYALINILGLAIGIAACLLIFLVVRYELSYDKFQPNYSSIYNIITKDTYSDGIDYTPGIPYPELEALRTDLPQLKTGALFCSYGSQVSVLENSKTSKKFIEDMGVFFADSQFFEIFQYTWLSGDKKSLSEPNNVVLTKSIATKYFNDWKTAVGKYIKIDNKLTFRVCGILEDVHANSDFPIRMVGSFITIKNTPVYNYTTDWGAITSNFQVYTLLPENVSRESIEKQLASLSKKYHKNAADSKRTNLLRPLSEIHFDTSLGNLGTHITSKSSLTTLTLIGFLIILMACINFINLSTAQAVSRSKEVGVRKVLGGNRVQLFWQMLGETKLIVLTGGLFAILIASLVLPFIKHVISIEEELKLFTGPSLLFFLLVLLIVTILSGIYPSLILSNFKPVVALKNKINSTTIGGISLRRGLVVIQFAISQILIIGTIVAITQMNYIRTADLGFNKEATLILYGSNDSILLAQQTAFKESLMQIPGVNMVSYNSDSPSSDNNWGANFAFDNKPDEKFSIFIKAVDENYFKTFGLQFLAGEGYQKKDSSKKIVVNETLLKKLNVKDPNLAIGKPLRMGGGKWKTICGVVKDFKTNSMRDEIRPMMLYPNKYMYIYTAVKLSSPDLLQTQKTIQKTWDKYFPDYVYASAFMDDTIEKFYQQEDQMTLLYKIFAGLAIFISCLGLYGLISFMVVQKTKEVGIRKVLGAGIGNILYLFSKEFTILIGIAFIIAAPIAYYFMNDWLQNFVFRTNIGSGVFIIAIITSTIVAWAAVGYKALRAALANPVKSLRTE